MIRRLLIANRGEIAVRVARTARRMGVHTVAVYSDADAGALHVEACDEAWRLGGALPRESYLDAARILDVARRARVDAIHPGYGFLSENAAFARACAEAGMVFVGPPPAAIEAMGSKSAAKRIMENAQVPLVPGYHGDDQSPALLAGEAARIGYPVLIKAVAGGGGKGMKVAQDAAGFVAALASAQREAKAGFGDDRVLVERYLTSPRHIEIQVFADAHGNVVYLFERDCSVQRRHQKVVEEAPAPGMTHERRRAMGEAAVAAARAIGYVGAGTVEFIAEQDGRFYFMEMNTRLQVEHPVTEMITGLDLVEWQLRVADGEVLPRRQDELAIEGHAIEARIYAEDPSRDFLPSIGRIRHWRMPPPAPGVRVDTGFRAGDEVSPYYDPMLAKLIVHGHDRDDARERLAAALDGCEVTGVATNIAFLSRLAVLPDFAEARLETGLIDKNREALTGPAAANPRALAVAAFDEWRRAGEGPRASAQDAAAGWDAGPAGPRPRSPWEAVDAWWPNSASHHVAFDFDDGGRIERVVLFPRGDGAAQVEAGGHRFTIAQRGPAESGERALDIDGERVTARVVAQGVQREVFGRGPGPGLRRRLARVDPLSVAAGADEGGGHLRAPMSGTIVAVMVAVGDAVEKGAPLVVLEAMKMEHTIVAPARGRVAAVNCAAGERVAEGSDLVDVEESST